MQEDILGASFKVHSSVAALRMWQETVGLFHETKVDLIAK